MEPLTDVRAISRIAYGYMASRALFAALEVGVFTHLAGSSKTLEQLVGDTGVTANRLETLLVSLRSLGLVTCADGHYANAPASEDFLVKGAPMDYGEYLRVVNGRMMYHGMGGLDAALSAEGGAVTPAGYESMFYREEGDAAAFSAAQHAGSLGPAAMFAKRVDLSRRERLLDVGGGSGAFTLALCRRNVGLTSTILDFPGTVDTAKHYAAEAGLSERVSHVEGNALTADWPAEQDAVLMSYLWSAIGEPDMRMVSAKAFAALKPGGVVLVHDFMATEEQDGPPIAVWHLLGSTIGNPNALCLTQGRVADMLSAAGLEVTERSEMLPGITSLVAAVKSG